MPNVNYQQRATEFNVGDKVYPLWGENTDINGRVLAVFPAIGMVDVEWPHGSERYPVEEHQLLTPEELHNPPQVGHDSVPGGTGTVSVPGGPKPQERAAGDRSGMTVEDLEADYSSWVNGPADNHDLVVESAKGPDRVAHAFVKKALYWASSDRQYKATKAEAGGLGYTCPKCKDATLMKATYKRRNGQSDRLLGCPICLFLIKREDIIGDPSYLQYDPSAEKQPFHRIRLTAGGGV